jgi:hypothetical protein
MKPGWLISRERRRAGSRLAMAVLAAGLVATPLAGVASADNGGGSDDSGESSGGGGGSGSSRLGDNTAWPPTEVYWPPTQGTDRSSNSASDGSGTPSALPTPIVMPGARTSRQ